MDPTSIYVGGLAVTLFIWTFIGLMMRFDTSIDWCPDDWKVFVVGIAGCLIWPIMVPVTTFLFYQKRKG